MADRLALCQVLAEGGLSARDGRGWVEVCLMVWRGGEEERKGMRMSGGKGREGDREESIRCHVGLRCQAAAKQRVSAVTL